MATTRSLTFGTLLGLLLAALGAAPSPAAAQTTATVPAYTAQSCAGTRYGKDLGCTSNDFTTSATFTQPPPGRSSCAAGDTITLDVVTTIVSNSPTRYDGAVFLGERGNDPSLNDASQSCSLGVFPGAPAPFLNLDGDQVGDFQSTSTATLTIKGATAYCQAMAGTNVLGLPYTLVFDNQSAGGATPQNVTASAPSKCVNTLAAQVTGVIVQGWIQLTVQSIPAGDPQVFQFTTSGTAAATPASPSGAGGTTQRIQVPLSPTGGTQTLTLDESLVAGWVPTAAITCTSPTGGAAPYVAVDPANRRITATLSAANYGANCTITNTRKATLTKAFSPSSVGSGNPSSLTFTLANWPGSPAQTGLGFTDTFPAGLAVASPLATSTTCGGVLYRGGTVTPLAAGDAAITFSGGALAGGASSCTVTVAVTSAAVGTYTNGAAQISSVSGALESGVTAQTLTVYPAPNLLMVKSASPSSVKPGDVVTWTLVVQNSGPGAANAVVITDPVSQYLAWSVNAYGPGVAFQFTDGSPASGLTLGTPAYSADGGTTWTLAPASGGGGAPAGLDGRVTSWRIPMNGTMAAGGQFTLSFKTAVK